MENDRRIVYLDNAATSWPKPREVIEAMTRCMTDIGANPGRSGHAMSIDASRVVFDARETVAEFFGLSDSAGIVFTMNATHALNIALKGVLQDGDHVVTSSMEHNSVTRPLSQLKTERGISVTTVACTHHGELAVDDLRAAFRPNTKLVVMNHGSNVVGTVMPIREIGEVCRQNGVLLLVDAAQTSGSVDIDVSRDGIDILAFTGHKALLGPQGTGGLCVKRDVEVKSLYQGGSGSRSEEMEHPCFMPDALEAGTLNVVGIAGLLAGVRYVDRMGLETIRAKEAALRRRLVEGLSTIDGVIIYGRGHPACELPVVSVNLQGCCPADVGYALDKEFGIMVRVGLHCAPLAHRTIDSFPRGTVRLSMSLATTEQEIDRAIDALTVISRRENA